MSGQHPARMGIRIAELRKIHGTTQQALAMRANVSYSLLRKVERGERPASPSFIAAIVRALSVSVLDITEQPYGARDAHPTSEQAGVPALRQAMVRARTPRWTPRCLSYAITSLYRLGHLDLSHLADERARAAARHGDDPLRAAVAEWNHSLILMFDGVYPAALRSIERADAIVDLAPVTPAMPAVRGALHLRAAIIAARTTNSDLAARHLVTARSLVVDGQDEADFYATRFGLPNVTIHEVSVPMELDDGTTAVSQAAEVTLPASTAPARVGHYWIDLARAWLLHGDRARALDSLQQAPDRPPTHPLPPTSPRDRARPRRPRRPIHRQPPALRRLVRHPHLTRLRT